MPTALNHVKLENEMRKCIPIPILIELRKFSKSFLEIKVE